jgi:hypothetical protein
MKEKIIEVLKWSDFFKIFNNPNISNKNIGEIGLVFELYLNSLSKEKFMEKEFYNKTFELINNNNLTKRRIGFMILPYLIKEINNEEFSKKLIELKNNVKDPYILKKIDNSILISRNKKPYLFI